jgi:hypothetical protein
LAIWVGGVLLVAITSTKSAVELGNDGGHIIIGGAGAETPLDLDVLALCSTNGESLRGGAWFMRLRQ